MSIIGSNILAGASGQGGAYEIERSLRFNDDDTAYLSRTPSSAGNQKTWTWSGWVKRSTLSGQHFLSVNNGGSISYLSFNGSNNLQFQFISGNYVTTNAVFRDVSAWYHVVFVFNSTEVSASDRWKFYVNGQEQSVTETGSIGLNNNGPVNSAQAHYLGTYLNSSGYWDGYMAEVNFVDGTALTASDFGETDSDSGAWIPKQYSGSHGSQGWYLDFSDNSGVTATTLGKDSSGNGNDWTPNNFSVTAGAGNDSLEDTPTTNWCTWNPLKKDATVTYANGNLDATAGGSTYASFATFVMSSGKWYWENTVNSNDGAGFPAFGIADLSTSENANAYLDATKGVAYTQAGSIRKDNSVTLSGRPTFTNTDVISVAFDADTGKVWFAKNGIWVDGSSGSAGDPGAGTNEVGTVSTAVQGYAPAGSPYNLATFSTNFGQRAFAYTPPTGFKALNTANLPEPTIKKGADYFNTVLYTGNGSSGQDITTVGFQPDFVWLKKRSGGTARSHQLYDSVRGAGVYLHTDFTDGENTFTDSLDAFLSNGFSLAGGNDGANGSTYPYVAWNWLAGGSSSSNTDGSITSTVSANADAGFSIITYTGNATAGATIGHGLNDAPKWLLIKRRNGADNWICWHGEPATTTNPERYYYEFQNTDSRKGPNTTFMLNGTAPTDSVITLYSDGAVNLNTGTFVCYAWAEVEGFSKMGYYDGNSSTDGTYVHTNFAPALLIIKRSDAADSWHMYDNKRETYNANDNPLYANLNNAESPSSTYAVDFLSNGFKLRTTNAGLNTGDYIWMAFAETPFKYANAR